MIPVAPQPEPASFHGRVRQKGLRHLQRKNIALDQPLPPTTEIESYWRDCLDDLYRSYRGTCAYLGVFFERVTGGGPVDHFIAKSKRADLAYEWSNYRLACAIMNSRKREYEDVLDPFHIKHDWFHLELVSGRIYPNPTLPDGVKAQVRATIERLGLDDPGNRDMRARHFQQYCMEGYPEDFLKKYSPFVWHEATRQALL